MAHPNPSWRATRCDSASLRGIDPASAREAGQMRRHGGEATDQKPFSALDSFDPKECYWLKPCTTENPAAIESNRTSAWRWHPTGSLGAAQGSTPWSAKGWSDCIAC